MAIAMDSSIAWLSAAGAAIWLGIGCYVVFIAIRQKALALKLKQLEQFRHDGS